MAGHCGGRDSIVLYFLSENNDELEKSKNISREMSMLIHVICGENKLILKAVKACWHFPMTSRL